MGADTETISAKSLVTTWIRQGHFGHPDYRCVVSRQSQPIILRASIGFCVAGPIERVEMSGEPGTHIVQIGRVNVLARDQAIVCGKVQKGALLTYPGHDANLAQSRIPATASLPAARRLRNA
jgi:hypothetical protein